MKKDIKISSLIVSFTFVIILTLVNVTAVYAWFDGQGYIGKTMSYSRNLYIGSTSASVTNYYGSVDASNNFVYTLINPLNGFQQTSLVPGSFIHIRTDIVNQSTQNNMYISLYLQDVIYDEPLHNYLYFGTNDPIINKETFKSFASYSALTNRYTIKSIPLLSNYTVLANQTVSLYWYLYIDSDAGMEVANSYINLGKVTLGYN